jgi:hypothetical protein
MATLRRLVPPLVVVLLAEHVQAVIKDAPILLERLELPR